jgi:hypothetical protein
VKTMVLSQWILFNFLEILCYIGTVLINGFWKMKNPVNLPIPGVHSLGRSTKNSVRLYSE